MKWNNCNNILVIRPDNMGDLIMSGPAIRALKETFNAKITILTSSMAKGIIPHMPQIDDSIIFDLPWVKTAEVPKTDLLNEVIDKLKEKQFDAAVVFTVFSQNPLPTAMLAYLAGIPRVLAYCRENPYSLITDWVPDEEPYNIIKHQVRRDLDLVATVGATTRDEHLRLDTNNDQWPDLKSRLLTHGFDAEQPWLILHAGVSEKKRELSAKIWIEAAKQLIREYGYQILLTGSSSEKQLTDELSNGIGKGCLSAGGLFSISEFICVVEQAPLMLSVNTGTIHIAAATQTPLVVLYAQTNPQHTPWKSPCKVIPFAVPEALKSKNQVLRYVDQSLYNSHEPYPSVNTIIEAVEELTIHNKLITNTI